MKRQALPLLLFLLVSNLSFGSFSIDWTRTTEIKDILTNLGTAVARDSKDNVYTTSSTGAIYLEKKDKYGNVKWQVSSSTTLPFNYEYPSWIHIDPQGNPVVIGFRYTSPSEGKHANSLIILKYDQKGKLIYKKNVEGDYSYFSSSPLSTYHTKITSQMDAAGNVYIGTAGGVTGYPNKGFTVVKFSPAGNVLWVSTKPFTSSTNFHFVNNIRLKGNRVGITGTTAYPSANATNWVIDTTGADLWSNIKDGVGGKDIAFDKSGNVYFLTWVSINFTGDIRVYKFNSLGSLLYQKDYDFGGSDLASRMEFAPDNTIVIMGHGNSYPGGSLYVDWITFKIKPNGTLVWSKKYAKHSGNDEIPMMMALDTDGDIFVTGIGGPFPGGSNLGRQQMVTVKYSSSGTEEWAFATDTLNDYNQGVGIAVAKDGSIFVVSSTNTFLLHILDHTGSDPCSAPGNLTAASINTNKATVSWSPVTNAKLYHVQYKPTTSLIWNQISTNKATFTLTNLVMGTTYDYRVEAICNSGPTGYSATQQFTTAGTGYCASKGLNATKEWIDLVYVGSLLNSTPESDGGYADYTYLSVDLVQGASYDITLSADMNPYGSTEVWRVWIDYNHDGDFVDAGEEEVGYSSEQIGWETQTFSVPATALTGLTRMRVSMKHGTAPTSCEVFAAGEVEDYTVNILPPKGGVVLNSVVSPAELIFSPNPSNDNSEIVLVGLEGAVAIQVFDMTGKLIYEQVSEANEKLGFDIREWRSGVYLVKATDENGYKAMGKLVRQ